MEDSATPSSDDERGTRLRQLQHDIKTNLSIISMGLQALPGLKDEPEEFKELCQTIEESGVRPLKEMVAEIIEVALSEPR
ncbi:MAG: hypothetical protein KDA79_05935 [Planctomycetaceae bacterium]|nr:hypothetical protein [Planctomycetaceae bacterium]